MSAWPTKSLDEIFEIARGGSPRPIDKFTTEDPDGINWIMIGDASAGSKYIRHTKKRIIADGASRSRRVKPGDFLLTNSMSFGKPYILDTHGCIHDGWLVLSPKIDNVDTDYFYHLLGSSAIYGEFERLAAGATVKNLNIDLVKSVKVALPPLDEQRRIAAILDQADELRRKRKRAIGRLSQLGQAIFHEMFRDPQTNPLGFPKIPLGDLIKVSSGSGLVASDQKGGDYPVYGGNGVNGWHNDFTVPAGTIVIGRVGVYCGAVHVTDRSAWVTDNALVVSLKQPVNSTYLAAALKTANLNQYAGRSAQPLVSGSRIYPIEVLNPPIDEQNSYEARIRGFDATNASFERSLTELNNLFSALQNRAFSGSL